MKTYLNKLCFLVLLNLICLNSCSQDNHAQLQSIMVDGYVLENFEPKKTNYLFYLPYTYRDAMPEIIPATTIEGATIELKNIENISGTQKGRGHLIELVRIFEKENPSLPMRVDHGRLMLDDFDKGYNPGYSFYGRMYALAQMDGVIATVQDEIKRNMNDKKI